MHLLERVQGGDGAPLFCRNGTSAYGRSSHMPSIPDAGTSG